MFVIGTAGHVDHGKSTLVHAMTGINPDRLHEEQVREMTIDLGFAWLELPSGRQVSMVDVPGHEDFIKNMLAGIGGIDVALLVVAADESIMPQTREHLAILDLLQVSNGVVAITKSDLAEGPEWLALVEEEVREELESTSLADARIVPVSAMTGAGLSDLLEALDKLLDALAPRPDLDRPRLPIDRVFTMSGFGTVVTGTLTDGRFRVGDEVAIVPGHISARIRGLQSHKARVEEALPGSRVAANLSGVAVETIVRGQVVSRPGDIEPTTLLDADLRLTSTLSWPLKHNAVVDFYSGSARVAAHVRLLGDEILEPGQRGWVQFRLSESIAVCRGDRYIVRLASPSVTIGGGKIVQTHPGRRRKRFRPDVLRHLQVLSAGEPDQVLLELLTPDGVTTLGDLTKASGLPLPACQKALEHLLVSDQILLLGAGLPSQEQLRTSGVGILSTAAWIRVQNAIDATLATYHRRYPLRLGMPRQELKSRLNLSDAFFAEILLRAVEAGRVTLASKTVQLRSHTVALTPMQERKVNRALALFESARSMPPSVGDVEQLLGPELLQYLLDEGRLVRVSDAVMFDAETFHDMKQRLVGFLAENQKVTVAQVRDLFGTSRKYALGFLEQTDRMRVTKRMGDVRVLR